MLHIKVKRKLDQSRNSAKGQTSIFENKDYPSQSRIKQNSPSKILLSKVLNNMLNIKHTRYPYETIKHLPIVGIRNN